MVFGMAPDFGGKPWSWIHHVAVETAARVNEPSQIIFWHEHEPTGEWWDRSRPYLTLRKIEAPREIFGRPLIHPAHRADVVRLQALLEHGGTYVDCDVWSLRPFANLEHGGFWMGRQGRSYGLCNATMGGDPGAAFAAAWLDCYQTFRSQGRDNYWDEHSVRLPLQLAAKIPLTVFPDKYFFHPSWGKIHRIFKPNANDLLRASYSVHLWESICWDWLQHLSPDAINRRSEMGRRLQEMGVL